MDPLTFAAAAAALTGLVSVRDRARRASASAARASMAPLDSAALSLTSDFPRLGAAIRALFPTDFSYTHLNHGSYGVAPKEVMQAARAVMDGIEAFPDDFMRRTALPRFRAAAEEVARFVGGEAGSVVFVENATAGVNAVLNSLRLKAGDAILINTHTYNACKNAAYWVAERCGAEVLTQPFPLPVSDPNALVADFEAYLDAHPNVRFALIDHITSPTAIVMPVERLCAACRARGVRVMVDGAHSPGQLSLDLASMGCDWYTGNLHKWCFALKGTALLYTAPARQAETQSLIISHFWRRSYAERFFMQGTNDQSRYLTARDGLAFIDAKIGGLDAMREYNTRLVSLGADILCAAWGTRRMNPPGQCAPFLCPLECPIDWRVWVRRALPDGTEADARGLPLAEAEAALFADEGFNERVANAIFFGYRIQGVIFPWRVVVGEEGRTEVRIFTRISAQVYNTPDDYRAFAAAVLDLKQKTGS
jgi:isopenicillin-N epimerase